MFIYKITVVPLNQVYIGLDTKLPYKQHRWKDHCRQSKKPNNTRKIHKAMSEHGIENCLYEIVEDGFTTLGSLALAEIKYIADCDSYRNGLNSSLGGDGLGHKNWAALSDDEINAIRAAVGTRFAEYNKKRWAGTTVDERRKMLKWHSPEANESRKATLIEYYKAFPDARKKKGEAIKQWQETHRDEIIERNRKNSIIGAAKVSKAIKVEFPDGNSVIYKSKSEAQRQTKQWMETLIRKTNEGIAHNGYRAWEI